MKTNIKEVNEHIEQLEKRISYLESVLREIQMLNALGKTLKINEAIQAAIETE